MQWKDLLFSSEHVTELWWRTLTYHSYGAVVSLMVPPQRQICWTRDGKKKLSFALIAKRMCSYSSLYKNIRERAAGSKSKVETISFLVSVPHHNLKSFSETRELTLQWSWQRWTNYWPSPLLHWSHCKIFSAFSVGIFLPPGTAVGYSSDPSGGHESVRDFQKPHSKSS